MHTPIKPTRTGADTILIVLFVAAISLPLTGQLMGLGAAPGSEKRKPTPIPAIQAEWKSFWSFPDRFANYYGDHFAYRAKLIRWHALAKYNLLHVSPSEKVILGKKGWFYYDDDNCMDDYRSANLFTSEQLKAWTQVLVARRDWLAAHGSRYLLVFVPDKYVVYPEYLPDAIHRVGQQFIMDQLAEYLQTHSDLEVLNLKPALLEAKKSGRIYHRTDSHWNDRGALVGYQKIIDRLTPWYPAVRPWSSDAFDPVIEETDGWDLPAMLQLTDVIREENLALSPKTPRQARLINLREHDARWNEALMIFERDEPALPKAVVLRDSFTSALVPFMAEHFRRVAFYWQTDLSFNLDLVKSERPEIVIQEVAGRKLYQSTAANPEEMIDERMP